MWSAGSGWRCWRCARWEQQLCRQMPRASDCVASAHLTLTGETLARGSRPRGQDARGQQSAKLVHFAVLLIWQAPSGTFGFGLISELSLILSLKIIFRVCFWLCLKSLFQTTCAFSCLCLSPCARHPGAQPSHSHCLFYHLGETEFHWIVHYSPLFMTP